MRLRLNPRNIISIGYSNYISLPVQWLRNIGIGKGDKIQITILESGELLLTPKLDEVEKNDRTQQT